MRKFKCIYGILDSNKDLEIGLKGLDGLSIYTLAYKDMSAAVSDIGKNNLKIDEQYAFVYARIIESIMTRHTILPMRFGTLVEDDSEIIALLEKYYDEFVINLRQVKGKLEYGLKVLWDIKEVGLRIKSLNKAEDSKGFDQLKGDSPYRKYLLEKLKEHKFEEALIEKAEMVVEDIHNQLKELSFLSKFKKMVTKRVVLDAVYLVEKEKKDAFIQMFKELEKKRQDLRYLFTGPWPPYNFIDNSNFRKKW